MNLLTNIISHILFRRYRYKHSAIQVEFKLFSIQIKFLSTLNFGFLNDYDLLCDDR